MFSRWIVLLFFIAHCAFSQTGNFKKADSLKKLISSKKGIEVIALKTNLAETILDSVPEESLKQAQEALKEIKKDGEQTALAYFVMGKAYSKLNQNDSAIFYLQKALPWFEKNPENKHLARSYYSLGLIFSQMSLLSEAYGSMEKAIKIYEKEKDTSNLGKAWNVIGIIYKERKEYQKALEYYKNALRHLNDPANEKVKALVYNNMGVVYQRLEK
ncbi:MAG: tetratricopeptide repeat protein, partial [Bacteroidia bacterium]|nr:tetratricopeptide repeat protein [Bacteroidia bacterium]